MAAAKRTLVRDTTTGRTVTPARAKADPRGTVTETVRGTDDELAALVKGYKRVKPPKGVTGAVADAYYQLKGRASLLARLTKLVDEDRKQLKKHIIDNLGKSDSGVAGKLARISIASRKQPVLEDAKKFHAYLKKTGDFDLITRAINAAAIQERWDAKKKIPGIGTFDYKTVSVNKV